MRSLTIYALFATAMAAVAPGAWAGDPERGESLYTSKCSGCHSIEKNRIGPRHRGVHGRIAGSLPDFDYSPALAESSVRWDDGTLDAWLQNPAKFIPGQRMFVRVNAPADRADIIAYLALQTDE